MTMRKEQDILRRELQSEMLVATYHMRAQEALDGKSDDVKLAFWCGYAMHNELDKELDEIWSRKEVIK
jgi:hypothetical protein